MKRRAFTLLEMLVVISIITIMMALLLVVLGSIRTRGKEVTASIEISQMHTAIGLFKAKYGIEPQIYGSGRNGRFQLSTSYRPSYLLKEATALKAVFPNMDLDDNGMRSETGNPITGPLDLDLLDANQSLVFWLSGGQYRNYRGFSTNPRQPFRRLVSGDANIGPFAEFAHLREHQLVVPSSHRQWVDPWGTPYAVFATPYPAEPFEVSGLLYSQESGNSAPTICPSPPSGTSIRIISAGADKRFGTRDDITDIGID